MTEPALSDYEAFLYAHRHLPIAELMALPECAGKNQSGVERIMRRAKRKMRGGVNGRSGRPTEAIIAEAQQATVAMDRLGKIAALLERSGIDPADVGRVEKVRLNEWQGMYKDDANTAQIVDMEGASVVLTPSWAEGPAWPVVQPGPALAITPLPERPRPHAREGMRVAVIAPDMQIGYFRDRAGTLHPTHDEAALDLLLQVIRATQPDDVFLLGDNNDFPEFSKYRLHKAFVDTTQATIDRATVVMAAIRANAGERAVIKYLEGNHDIRVPNYTRDNAEAAYGLRQGSAPESWPVLSVPYLCRLDEVGIEYIPGYPANEIWINDRLVGIHGDKASKGSNAHSYLSDERVSVIYGHIHRREWAERTKRVRNGYRTYLAACPGALCRTDGTVPSTRGGVDLDGVPITRWEDWQQGLAVVTYTPGDGPFWYEAVPIHGGMTHFHGRLFHATCDVEGNPLEDAA